MKKILFSILALVAIATTAGAQGNSINGHEYVDLGLPSGLLWATCNVGADKPEDYGDYFAWGETTTKEKYSWDTYTWGTKEALTKYTGSDGKTVLDPEDDAAAVNWKGGWRMPTIKEFNELLEYTTQEWMNDVKGYKFTSKTNGKSIFLPRTESSYYGHYWLSEFQGSNFPFRANNIEFWPSTKPYKTVNERHKGHCVRPVIKKSEIPTGIEINETNFPDEKFRNIVADKKIDKDENGYLSDEEIAAVKTLVVANKKITDLKGIEFFAALETFSCYTNQLTSLNVSANKKLTKLDCSENKISVTEMQVLVDGLPTVTGGLFYAIDTGSSNEGNVITKSQVNIAKGKGWIVYSWHNGSNPTEYEGSDDPTTDPKTLAVTFTKATTLLTELSKQDLNVLAAVVFLAQSGLLSNYSVVDNTSMGVRTITLKKGRTPRDSKILFVMNPNKGITVPSDVTSADNINVTLTPDLRKALEQADLATQLAGYDAIQIKFDTTTGLTAVEGGQLTVDSWYSIDGKKLNGEPTKKGVYIIKGKKVKK